MALALVLVTWGVWSSIRKARAVEIDRLLRQTRELLEKDSYASYKEAAKLCERILERDEESLGGHAYLAYIDAVRFGEHGEGEGLRGDARKHLEAVARVGQHSHAYAAEAYLRGDRAAADAIWHTERYAVYVQSLHEHFEIVEETIQPGAHIFWEARSRSAQD